MSDRPPNRLCSLLGIEIPVLQAPMTYIAGATLASAVSNAGGLGVIETASEQGRDDLKRVRDLTDRPVAANVALRMMRDPSVVDLLADAQIRIVTTSAGDPAILTERLRAAGMTVLHVVGSARAARKAVDAGVDGLIVEGVEGGGFKHTLGPSTMVLLPLVARQFDVPIVSAGGICDAVSMAAAMVLGADGVQLGTRLLASKESPVHVNFKQAIVDADDMGTMLVSVPGWPTMRVIRTAAADAAATGGLDTFGLDTVRELYFSGAMEASLANTGQVAGRIDEIASVEEIIRGMWDGCASALSAGRARLGHPALEA